MSRGAPLACFHSQASHSSRESRRRVAGQQLQHFARFADRTAGGQPLTQELALRWAQSSSTGKQTTAARRLLILRPFTRYLRTVEPLTEIPPDRILGPA